MRDRILLYRCLKRCFFLINKGILLLFPSVFFVCGSAGFPPFSLCYLPGRFGSFLTSEEVPFPFVLLFFSSTIPSDLFPSSALKRRSTGASLASGVLRPFSQEADFELVHHLEPSATLPPLDLSLRLADEPLFLSLFFFFFL